MAAKMPELGYACEICGLEGLTGEGMRSHVIDFHLEGASACPFCGKRDGVEGLPAHINAVHLDYLAPRYEYLEYIDDEDDEDVDLDYDDEDDEDGRVGSRKNINLSNKSHKNNNNNNSVNNVSNNNSFGRRNEVGADGAGSGGGGAEGSPLRMQLNLNLKGRNAPVKQKHQRCMICGLRAGSPTELEEHINRDHFDLSSPTAVASTPESPTQDFRCPLCVRCFPNGRDLEFHVNMEHRDILSPGKSSTPGSAENWSEGCPVCCRTSFKSTEEMAAHIEEHFSNGTPATPDLSSDRLLAKEIDKREKESMKQREQREFELLQAQYGMDNQGNFREQSLTNMQKAVYAGEMSVSDFYERQIGLRFAENNGIDDGSSCTRDLLPGIRAASQASANVVRVLTCTAVDHYASTYGDKGWGCGYRNLQMLISSLLHHAGYSEMLFKPSALGGGFHGCNGGGTPPRGATPSISKIQQHIEWAWKQGFDVQGSDQLGGKLHNTRKWIGATEIVTVLSSLRIRCQLVDFDRPTSPDDSHPELFNWVLQYFQRYEDFKAPLYLQHQGHSRTIVGIEEYRDGHLALLVFDPSHSPEQMRQLRTSAPVDGMRLIRRTLSAMKARQYQLVAVRGIVESEREYQQSKLLRSIRIPQEL